MPNCFDTNTYRNTAAILQYHVSSFDTALAE